MAPTIKAALADALEDLRGSDFDKFCHHLLDRREQPRVKRNRVEGKSRLEVTDALVSTFTEEGALTVVLEILNAIGCGGEAKELEEAAPGKSSKAGPSDTSSAGAAGGGTPTAGGGSSTPTAGDKHFVDKHKLELIRRVSNIDPILDELQANDVIDQGNYDKIRALSTSQDKMRELYCTRLGTNRAKDIFYDILFANERFLVDELREKK